MFFDLLSLNLTNLNYSCKFWMLCLFAADPDVIKFTEKRLKSKKIGISGKSLDFFKNQREKL